jgi:hypothetical protein
MNFVTDSLLDLEGGTDTLGEVGLNVFAKWFIDRPASVGTQNFFYQTQYLTDKLSAVGSEVEAEELAFYILAVNSDSLVSHTVKARCNDTGIVQTVFDIMRNTTRTYAQNYTVDCGGYVWSWSSATTVLTVVPKGESLRRLAGIPSGSRKLESFGFECQTPALYYRIPVATCAAVSHWMTGFTGFRYSAASQPGTIGSIGNAIVSSTAFGAATVVVYNQQGATAGAFILPILWFLSWMAIATWDRRDKDKIYDDKRLNYLASAPHRGIEDSFNENKKSPADLKLNSAFARPGLSVASNAKSKTDATSLEESTVETETEKFHVMFGAEPSLLHEQKTLSRFLHVLFREHYFLSWWSYASLALPRHIRYLALWSHLLAIIFTNTVFITVIAAVSRDCSVHRSESECHAALDGATAIQQQFSSLLTECDWSGESNECTRAALPYTFGFVALATAAALCLATCINSFLWNFFWAGICAKQPCLEDIGLSSDFWLDVRRRPWEEEEDSSLNGHENMSSSTFEEPDITLENLYVETESLYSSNWEKEAMSLIRHGVKHLHFLVTSLPSLDGYCSEGSNDTVAAPSRTRHIEAITRFLRMNDDGSPQQLSLYHGILHGTARQHVQAKIQSACSGSVEIIQELGAFSRYEKDCKDIVLLQNFVISQFDTMKRVALQRELLQFDKMSGGSVAATVWIAAWLLVLSINFIMLIFVGITIILADLPEALVSAWTVLIFFTVVQEALFVIPVKLFLFHVVLVKSALPQLRSIYRTLASVATRWNQDSEEEMHSLKSTTSKPSDTRAGAIHHELIINKHFIPACRASRMDATRCLAAAELLRKLTDCDILECRTDCHLSPNLYTKIIMAVPTLISLGSTSSCLIAFDIVVVLQWSVGLVLGYAVLLTLWYVFITVTLMLVSYVAYLYLIRKPYLKRIRMRGASGRSTWRSRTFGLNGAPKNALRLAAPTRLVQHFTSKTVKMLSGGQSNTVPHRAALAWRNMNRSYNLQGQVLRDPHVLSDAKNSFCQGSPELLSVFYDPLSYSDNMFSQKRLTPSAPIDVLQIRRQFSDTRQVLRWRELGALSRFRTTKWSQSQLEDLYNLSYVPQNIEENWSGGFEYYKNILKKKLATSVVSHSSDESLTSHSGYDSYSYGSSYSYDYSYDSYYSSYSSYDSCYSYSSTYSYSSDYSNDSRKKDMGSAASDDQTSDDENESASWRVKMSELTERAPYRESRKLEFSSKIQDEFLKSKSKSKSNDSDSDSSRSSGSNLVVL